MRAVSIFVLPDPAPARTMSGPSVVVEAWRCLSFRLVRNAGGSAFGSRGGRPPAPAIHWGGRLADSDEGANSKSIMKGEVVTFPVVPGKGWRRAAKKGGGGPVRGPRGDNLFRLARATIVQGRERALMGASAAGLP